jgi:hypothetical protein
MKKSKKRNLIEIDLSGCKNWGECMKVMGLITSGKIKIDIKTLNV